MQTISSIRSFDVSAVLARNRIALARAISLIENHRYGAEELHARLLPHCGRAHVIGITGAPGAGKSTLINALLAQLLNGGLSVAVLAVDPSSPISGGAILGDRVRMAQHDGNDNVFIRSVSSRGHLGGLSQTAGQLIDVFDAAGFGVILVETVGTGQSEVEISRHADTRVVVCPPGLGDDVQTIKAGILEIADILVVNKADLPQAQRAQLDLQALQALRHPSGSGWQVPVLATIASESKGIAELIDAAREHARVTGVGQRRRIPQSTTSATPSSIGFDTFSSDAALGVTLGHTLQVGPRKLKKGQVLGEDDIAALRLAGVASVSGARLQGDDATEDSAANEIAGLLGGNGCETRPPYTGRCNLHASHRGILVIDQAAILRLNSLDEAITVATLPPWSSVRKGQVIATVKIIPLGVRRHVLTRCRLAIAAPPLAVAELVPRRAALILSHQAGYKDSAMAATSAVTRLRLSTLGSRLALELRCAHNLDALANALRQARAAGCELILVSGVTAAKDRRDVAPAAIVAAGGRIERFGMPVEPGNMLLLAYLHDIPVIVMPGCARSRRLNGLDWVLQRLLANLPVATADIAAMGVGGLIRSMPEDQTDTDSVLPEQPIEVDGPRLAVLILAAGRSTRMGSRNKMLTPVDGIPLVVRARNAALASRATTVTLVTGFEAEAVEQLVAGDDITIVRNPDFDQGLAGSLRRGVEALPSDVDGVAVLLADMPQVSAAHLDLLIAAFCDGEHIVVPMHAGQRGNPILWPRRYFAEMRNLEGDQGARQLLLRHAAEIKCVEMPDAATTIDVDTPADLERLLGRSSDTP